MNNIVRRIFADRKRPADLTDEQYDAYLQQQFPTWITEFENNGFLEATKLPPISSEDELLSKLHQHRDQLVVLKYWKHGCLPCLSMAEMYKDAEKQTLDPSHPLYKKVVWYSVDTKAAPNKEVVDYQMVNGTPSIQTFLGGRQVGSEIRATQLTDLMGVLQERAPK